MKYLLSSSTFMSDVKHFMEVGVQKLQPILENVGWFALITALILTMIGLLALPITQFLVSRKLRKLSNSWTQSRKIIEFIFMVVCLVWESVYFVATVVLSHYLQGHYQLELFLIMVLTFLAKFGVLYLFDYIKLFYEFHKAFVWAQDNHDTDLRVQLVKWRRWFLLSIYGIVISIGISLVFMFFKYPM